MGWRMIQKEQKLQLALSQVEIELIEVHFRSLAS